MTHLLSPTLRRPLVRVLLLAGAVAAAPLHCLAQQAAPPTGSNAPLRAAFAGAVERDVAATRSAALPQQTGSTTDLGSRSFFRSPAGIVTLVVVGAGLGFALYSTSNDRVESPKVSYEGGQR